MVSLDMLIVICFSKETKTFIVLNVVVKDIFMTNVANYPRIKIKPKKNNFILDRLIVRMIGGEERSDRDRIAKIHIKVLKNIEIIIQEM